MITELVNETNGKFFSVDFIKKDGSIRKMVCRKGVKKYLKGGDKKTPNTVITVFDVNKKEYRCFYPENVINFKCGKLNWNRN